MKMSNRPIGVFFYPHNCGRAQSSNPLSSSTRVNHTNRRTLEGVVAHFRVAHLTEAESLQIVLGPIRISNSVFSRVEKVDRKNPAGSKTEPICSQCGSL